MSQENCSEIKVCVYIYIPGTFLVVQWLRLCTPNAGALDSTPGQGTRSRMLQRRPSAAK